MIHPENPVPKFPSLGARKFDNLLDSYYAKHQGPLGSTDRKCVIDIESIFEKLNVADSELASSWTEKDMAAWMKTLGSVSPEFAPTM